MNSRPHSAWRLAPAALTPARPEPVPALVSRAADHPASPALASTSSASPAPTTISPPLSLRLAACCNIVMGLVMGYMLIISL